MILAGFFHFMRGNPGLPQKILPLFHLITIKERLQRAILSRDVVSRSKSFNVYINLIYCTLRHLMAKLQLTTSPSNCPKIAKTAGDGKSQK
jgi:hypothetical protein